MEHAQRVSTAKTTTTKVLILILMEHAQKYNNGIRTSYICYVVLILILMEHAQRVTFSVENGGKKLVVS